MKKKIKSEKQKLQSVKKLLELNMQTEVSVLLTFPHLNNPYFWEWTTWSGGKALWYRRTSDKERANRAVPLILLSHLRKPFGISRLEFHSWSLKPCSLRKCWLWGCSAQYSKILPILRCLSSLLYRLNSLAAGGPFEHSVHPVLSDPLFAWFPQSF